MEDKEYIYEEKYEECPECLMEAMVNQAGCWMCLSCGFSYCS